MNTSNAIVRILEIVDTRTYEEQGDRWVPIPGSGQIRQCSRCKREHEIHATVELSDGTTDVVGTGCAAREAMDLAPQFRSEESRAKRVAALRAEVAGMERSEAAYRAACAAVEAMPVPPVEEHATEWRVRALYTRDDVEYRCGTEGRAIVRKGNDLDERRRCAVNGWRTARIVELAGDAWRFPSIPLGRLADARKRLAKLTAERVA